MKMFSNKTDEEMLLRAQEVINRVDLKDADNKYPSEISGGMKKRVAIARAIVLIQSIFFVTSLILDLIQRQL